MLILTRRVGETLMIGDEVTVTVLGVKGNQCAQERSRASRRDLSADQERARTGQQYFRRSWRALTSKKSFTSSVPV
jgi:hypothetical protein